MRVYVLTEFVSYKTGGYDEPFIVGVFDNDHIDAAVEKRADWYLDRFKMKYKTFRTPQANGKFGVRMWDDGMVVTLTAEPHEINI